MSLEYILIERNNGCLESISDHTEEEQVALLKDMAKELGYSIIKNKEENNE